MQIITVTIDEAGDADIDLAGFHGKGCHALQEAFAAALGRETSKQVKPEYHRPCDTKTKLQQHQ